MQLICRWQVKYDCNKSRLSTSQTRWPRMILTTRMFHCKFLCLRLTVLCLKTQEVFLLFVVFWIKNFIHVCSHLGFGLVSLELIAPFQFLEQHLNTVTLIKMCECCVDFLQRLQTHVYSRLFC